MITHIGGGVVNVYAILQNCTMNNKKGGIYPQEFICNLPEGTLGILIDKRTFNDRVHPDVYQILLPKIGLGWVYSAWLKVVK